MDKLYFSGSWSCIKISHYIVNKLHENCLQLSFYSYFLSLSFSPPFILKLLKEIARKRRSIRLGREVELKPYIAAHFEVLPTEFTLGDKKHYGGFENKQLQSGQEYVFFVLAVMEHSESVS